MKARTKLAIAAFVAYSAAIAAPAFAADSPQFGIYGEVVGFTPDSGMVSRAQIRNEIAEAQASGKDHSNVWLPDATQYATTASSRTRAEVRAEVQQMTASEEARMLLREYSALLG